MTRSPFASGCSGTSNGPTLALIAGWRSCPDIRIIDSVLESLAGREYPPTPGYLVGQEKIREFAAAIGDGNAAYHDSAAARTLGYGDVVAPPTFPAVVAQEAVRAVLADPDLGVDPTQVVHSRLKMSYTRPAVAGDELTARAVIDRADLIDGKLMLSIRCAIGTPRGEHVVTARVSLIVRRTGPGA